MNERPRITFFAGGEEAWRKRTGGPKTTEELGLPMRLEHGLRIQRFVADATGVAQIGAFGRPRRR